MFQGFMSQAIRKIDLIEAIKRNREEKDHLSSRLAELEREWDGLQMTLERFDKIAAACGRGNGKLGDNAPGSAKNSGKKSVQRAQTRPPPPQGTGSKGAHGSSAGRRRRSSDVSVALRRLIQVQTDEFTGPQIVGQLEKTDAALAERIPDGYMSTLLWRMAQARQISLVRRGAPGEPHVYCTAK
ncbi:MAG: hypothetical protein C0518_06815 [Opitutus sp.]|nr:hypothetical protein [Opitutus sp.]